MFISLVFTFYHSPTTLPLAFHQLLSYAYALLLMLVAISIRFCVVSPYHHCTAVVVGFKCLVSFSSRG